MYYAGGYAVAGGYYAGDPGFFDSLGRGLKRAAGVVLSTGLGYLTGGLKGAIGGAAAGAGTETAAGIREETLAAGGQGSAYTPAMRAKHAEIIARGGAGYLQRGGMQQPLGMGPGMALMLPGGRGLRRMHPNKSTYVTRGGGTSRWPVGLTVHPKGTEAVPSRRMNVVNPRALRRASRRIRGAVKILRRIIRDSTHLRGKGAHRRVSVRRK